MTLPTRNFDQIVADQQAALQVNDALYNFTPGSDLLAFAEANTGVALFLQWLIYRVLKSTRLATSVGGDCDSFGADFLFARYPAVPATGQVLMSRFTALSEIQIPLNTVVRTRDNANSYIVIADSSNPNYNEVTLSYHLPAGTTQMSVLVQAMVPGEIGNVAPNQITKVVGSIAISTVTNPAPFVNGVDQESDDAYRSRFQLFINSRYRATEAAVQYAITSTQTGLTYTLLENVDTAGNVLPGNFVIYYDDGTGDPPSLLTDQLRVAVEEVRPITVSFSVAPAVPITVSVEFSTTWYTGFDPNSYKGIIGTAVSNYINGLAVGQTLFLTKLYQVIYDAAPQALQDAYGLLINGVASDLVIAANQVARFLTTASPPSEMVID